MLDVRGFPAKSMNGERKKEHGKGMKEQTAHRLRLPGWAARGPQRSQALMWGTPS